MKRVLPTIAPTHVFHLLCCFMGVYISAYRPTLAAAKPAVKGFTYAASKVTPPMLERDAAVRA